MQLKHIAPLLLLGLSLCQAAAGVAAEVAVCTDTGRFTLELHPDEAPNHVDSFLAYVDQGFYADTVFHRVISGFVVQGGGFDRLLRVKQAGPPVDNESRNGLRNERGALAAARTADPHSATSQFYINLRNNPALDATGESLGHTVFGRVREGMEVVDEIARLPTGAAGPFSQDVPNPLVGVRWMARLDRAALQALPADARTDTIRSHIGAAEDPAEILEWVGHLRAICVRPEPDVFLTEAEAALATERPQRALHALVEYFSTAGEEHPGREQAGALYTRLVQAQLSERARALAANCTVAPPVEVPDGGAATAEEMRQGQQRVQAYVNEAEDYLDCLAAIIDDPELEISDEDRNLLVTEHNAVVDTIEAVAEQFNRELATFRAREPQ